MRTNMLLSKNDVVEASNLMLYTWKSDEYTYERNEMFWMQGLINHIGQQQQGNKNYLAIKAINEDGSMSAFLLASTFNESYNGDVVMNINDMIVDTYLPKSKNARDVMFLVDQVVEYCKVNNIKHWRADSIHESAEAYNYINFLNKKYDGSISYTFRGKL